MEPITVIRSRTVVMPSTNIDTDQIIPARFLTTTVRDGLGVSLFADWRYDETGQPRADFVLNQPQSRGCQILVAGRNIGCGSSREHAPWALLDYGFRALIAPSFADIFYNNCFKNGVLPIVLPEEIVNQLLAKALEQPGFTLTVDLESQTISGDAGLSIPFEVDAFRRHCLLNGLDDIGLTLQNEAEITAFESRRPAWLSRA